MPVASYNQDIAKWGLLARAIVARPELVSLFEKEGVKKEELEEISSTERAAEAADRAQRAATTEAQEAARKIEPVEEKLNTLFADLKQRKAFVVKDLTQAGDTKTLALAQKIEFGAKAIPRVPDEAKTQDGKAPEPEEREEERYVEDRESKAQKVLANAAGRLALYLKDHEGIYNAFVKRKMPPEFREELAKYSEELIRLRENRVLALSRQKKATEAEHAAVTSLILARKPIQPILLKLTAQSTDLDALAVEHLQILSAKARAESKQKTNAKEKARQSR